MTRLQKITQRAKALAEAGEKAAKRRDLAEATKIGEELTPLLREIAELTGDDSFIEIAQKGEQLVAESKLFLS